MLAPSGWWWYFPPHFLTVRWIQWRNAYIWSISIHKKKEKNIQTRTKFRFPNKVKIILSDENVKGSTFLYKNPSNEQKKNLKEIKKWNSLNWITFSMSYHWSVVCSVTDTGNSMSQVSFPCLIVTRYYTEFNTFRVSCLTSYMPMILEIPKNNRFVIQWGKKKSTENK